MQKPTAKIYLNLHNKLALPEGDQSSRALLSVVHIAFACNWLSTFFGILPLAGLLPIAIALWVESRRHNPFAKEALNFAKERLYLTLGIIFALIFYTVGVQKGIQTNNLVWLSASTLFTLLSLYDAYYTYKGGLGLKLIRPIKEQIKRRLKNR